VRVAIPRGLKSAKYEKKERTWTARLKLCPFKTSLKRLFFANCSGVRFGRRLRRLRLVGPPPTEQVSFVLGSHGGKYHHAHDQEDQQENDGNNEDWHTSPLRPFWNADARHAVIAITDGCEPTPQANVGRKREGNEVGEQLDVLVWRSDCEAKVLQLCGRQAGSPIRDGPRAAVSNPSIYQFASAAICLSKSDNVRCISSLKRSLLLFSSCCKTRLRDRSRSDFFIWLCACSALSARFAAVGLAERDSSI
jgi:hypothetical protein